MIEPLKDNATLSSLSATAAISAQKLLRFDRVMIYQFHPDGHGEVIAEAIESSKRESINAIYGVTLSGKRHSSTSKSIIPEKQIENYMQYDVKRQKSITKNSSKLRKREEYNHIGLKLIATHSASVVLDICSLFG